MLLFLERLPPLISHMSCLFLGLLIYYYVGSSSKEPECFVAGKVFLAFQDKDFAKGFISPPLGKKIYFAKTSLSGQECLIKNASATVVQNEPFLVTALNMKSSAFLSEILSKKNRGHLKLVSESKLESYQTCSNVQIQYAQSY